MSENDGDVVRSVVCCDFTIEVLAMEK